MYNFILHIILHLYIYIYISISSSQAKVQDVIHYSYACVYGCTARQLALYVCVCVLYTCVRTAFSFAYFQVYIFIYTLASVCVCVLICIFFFANAGLHVGVFFYNIFFSYTRLFTRVYIVQNLLQLSIVAAATSPRTRSNNKTSQQLKMFLLFFKVSLITMYVCVLLLLLFCNMPPLVIYFKMGLN